jgi:hypothetical protein
VKRSTFLQVIASFVVVGTFAWAQPAQAADPVVVLKTSEGTRRSRPKIFSIT